jgi:peptidoglycan/xylan/chitin deacetylase (PgdA/CDA1 family)
VALCLGATGCGLRELPDRCAGGDGLTADGYGGATLPAETAALTFDGGPTDATGAIGDVLSAAGVRATFFVDGRSLAGSEAVLDRLVEQGHLLGQRGWSGRRLADVADVATEVRRTDEALAPWISGGMYLLRPVGGELSDEAIARLAKAGLGRYVGPITWEIGPGAGLAADDAACEGAGTSTSVCAAALASEIRAQGRAVVAMRGDSSFAADVTRALVAELADDAYKTVRVDGIGDVARALVLAGARPESVGGGEGCDEY